MSLLSVLVLFADDSIQAVIPGNDLKVSFWIVLCLSQSNTNILKSLTRVFISSDLAIQSALTLLNTLVKNILFSFARVLLFSSLDFKEESVPEFSLSLSGPIGDQKLSVCRLPGLMEVFRRQCHLGPDFIIHFFWPFFRSYLRFLFGESLNKDK